MKAKELRGMSREELLKKLDDTQMQLLKLKMQVAQKATIKNNQEIKNLRRLIARIKTILKNG